MPLEHCVGVRRKTSTRHFKSSQLFGHFVSSVWTSIRFIKISWLFLVMPRVPSNLVEIILSLPLLLRTRLITNI